MIVLRLHAIFIILIYFHPFVNVKNQLKRRVKLFSLKVIDKGRIILYNVRADGKETAPVSVRRSTQEAEEAPLLRV